MKKYALGIDLGGTGTKFGLVSEDGQVLRSNSIPTQQYPEINEYCDELCERMRQLVKDEGIELSIEEAEAYLSELEDFELDGEHLKTVAGGTKLNCWGLGSCPKEGPQTLLGAK